MEQAVGEEDIARALARGEVLLILLAGIKKNFSTFISILSVVFIMLLLLFHQI